MLNVKKTVLYIISAFWFGIILACGGGSQVQRDSRNPRGDLTEVKPSLNTSPNLELESDTDEFRGTTTHALIVRQQGWGARVSRFSGDSGPTLFSFISSSESGWRYLRCHRLDMLADNNIVNLPMSAVEHDGRVGNGYVLEFITVGLTVENISQLASASVVRFRVCNDVFEMPSGFGEQLSILMSRS